MKLSTVARVIGTLKWWKPLFFLVFWPDSFLLRSGWLRSFLARRSFDAEAHPIPWYTYAATDFVASRVKPGMRVFEWGAGNSTLWYAQRVKNVIACEHDRDWAQIIGKELPANAEVVERGLAEGYVEEIARHPPAFDIIAIDGKRRNECVETAVAALSGDGVIVFDNTDWKEFEPGTRLLERQGFKRIDFTGMSPINVYGSTTSVFYRDRNCFDI